MISVGADYGSWTTHLFLIEVWHVEFRSSSRVAGAPRLETIADW